MWRRIRGCSMDRSRRICRMLLSFDSLLSEFLKRDLCTVIWQYSIHLFSSSPLMRSIPRPLDSLSSLYAVIQFLGVESRGNTQCCRGVAFLHIGDIVPGVVKSDYLVDSSKLSLEQVPQRSQVISQLSLQACFTPCIRHDKRQHFSSSSVVHSTPSLQQTQLETSLWCVMQRFSLFR